MYNSIRQELKFRTAHQGNKFRNEQTDIFETCSSKALLFELTKSKSEYFLDPSTEYATQKFASMRQIRLCDKFDIQSSRCFKRIGQVVPGKYVASEEIVRDSRFYFPSGQAQTQLEKGILEIARPIRPTLCALRAQSFRSLQMAASFHPSAHFAPLPLPKSVLIRIPLYI